MSDNSFKKARLDYNIGSIDFNNIIDPIILFRKWFDEVYKIDKEEAVSMNLSTISSDNYPNSRIVLLRGLEDGFIFYTNYKSQKGREIEKNPKAHINFYWPSLERQVRIKGIINKTLTRAVNNISLNLHYRLATPTPSNYKFSIKFHSISHFFCRE